MYIPYDHWNQLYFFIPLDLQSILGLKMTAVQSQTITVYFSWSLCIIGSYHSLRPLWSWSLCIIGSYHSLRPLCSWSLWVRYCSPQTRSNSSRSLSVIWHLTKMCELEHVDTALVELHYSLVTIDTQQLSRVLTIVTQDNFHLKHHIYIKFVFSLVSLWLWRL